MNYIIDVLLGSKNRNILERGHQQLSVYGIVDDFSKEELRRIIGQLVSRKLIVKNGDGYPILELSPEGREFLRKREEIRLSRFAAVTKLSPVREAEGGYDRTLFEQLRRLRKQIADEQGVPPFVVFGDLALQQMALYLPQSEENFIRINGVGEEKLRKYGQAFMEVIQTHARENNLGEKSIPGKRSPMSRRVKREGSTYQETKKLVLQKMSLKEMAKTRGLTASTIVSHLEKLRNAGEEIDIDYLQLPPARFETIKAAFLKSGGMALTPVKEMLGDDFSYEELGLARLFMK